MKLQQKCSGYARLTTLSHSAEDWIDRPTKYGPFECWTLEILAPSSSGSCIESKNSPFQVSQTFPALRVASLSWLCHCTQCAVLHYKQNIIILFVLPTFVECYEFSASDECFHCLRLVSLSAIVLLEYREPTRAWRHQNLTTKKNSPA